MTTSHPSADMLRAIADGKQMQQDRTYIDSTEPKWTDCSSVRALYLISCEESNLVRIKPETVLINGIECPAPMRVASAAAAQVDALVQALIGAQRAINSMKAEAETAAQGDEQMMLDACEQISNEGLEASLAIQAALSTAAQPPAGWRMVPVEPTIGMCIAGDEARITP